MAILFLANSFKKGQMATMCVFIIVLHFESTYYDSFTSMETNLITKKTQRNADIACVIGLSY